MSEIVFQPCIGPHYGQTARRTMVVAESHHSEPCNVLAKSTETVVENWRLGRWSVRYLTVLARILSGKEAWEVDRRTVLDEVAFYNFVQAMMEKGQHPTKQQAQASQGAFMEALNLCSPTHIISGSYLAWENMPTEQCRAGTLQLDGMTIKVREYQMPKGPALAIPLPHLSRTPAPMWQQVVKEFLALDSRLLP